MAGERATLLGLLQFQRESLVRKVADVPAQAATHSPLGSGTSLLWLVKHLTEAELSWFLVRFAGEEIDLPDQDAPPGDTIVAAVAAYRQAWARVAPVIEQADLDTNCRHVEANLRWVLGHMLEETARHAGHADILRELLDGQTGR